MHRLISCTNRRMRKGFPEMLTYLLRKPMTYCSHEFEHFPIDRQFRITLRALHQRLGHPMPPPSDCTPFNEKARVLPDDYCFRPVQLERFPLYFFLAGCVARTKLGPGSLQWSTLAATDGSPLR